MRLYRANVQTEAYLSGVPYSEYRHYLVPGFEQNVTPVGTLF